MQYIDNYMHDKTYNMELKLTRHTEMNYSTTTKIRDIGTLLDEKDFAVSHVVAVVP
jgi:hypothetical protein